MLWHDRLHRAAEDADPSLPVDQTYAEAVTYLDRAAAFRMMLDVLPKAVGMDMAFIAECEGTERLVITHLSGNRTDALQGLLIPRGLGLGGKVLALGQVELVDDYARSAAISHDFDRPVGSEGLRSVMATPIRHGERFLGVLYVAKRCPVVIGGRVIEAVESAAARMAAAAITAERAQVTAAVAVHEERRRMALELHDNVGAMLFAIKAGLSELGEQLARDPAVQGRIADLERQAREASTILRESLRALSCSPQEVALAVALRGHCSAFEEQTGLPARLVIMNETPGLDQSCVRALTETVREALLNVRKHAKASSVVVIVSADRNGVTVAVVDDGLGLREAADGGLGLEGCAERLGRVGGYLNVDENDDGGVTLRAWVPT